MKKNRTIFLIIILPLIMIFISVISIYILLPIIIHILTAPILLIYYIYILHKLNWDKNILILILIILFFYVPFYLFPIFLGLMIKLGFAA